MQSVLEKLQAPTSKFQISTKLQAPNGLVFFGHLWILDVGISLELGAWDLELFTFARFAHPSFNG